MAVRRVAVDKQFDLWDDDELQLANDTANKGFTVLTLCPISRHERKYGSSVNVSINHKGARKTCRIPEFSLCSRVQSASSSPQVRKCVETSIS